jgi:CHASE1-domain containing sensor protein
MIAVLATALLSALLSSLCVFATAWYLYQHHLREQLEATIRARVDELGGVIEERVKAGIMKAVDELTSVDTLSKTVTRSQDQFLSSMFGIRPRSHPKT